MNQELQAAILRRLSDFEFKESGKWLQEGRCPNCHKKTLYAPVDGPWVVRCNRLNQCGFEDHIKDLYPDLFDSWSDRHQRTPENPHAAADAYLRDARGFDLARIAGWYRQESYWDPALEIGSATVRFPLSDGSSWERLIDRPHRFGDKKALFHGPYSGTWWQPPGATPAQSAEIWLVEGIFDAIALFLRGLCAVSIMACNNYPEKALAGLRQQCGDSGRPDLVWALDGDKAGRAHTKKWVERARAEGWPCKAATIPHAERRKLDWNDLHQRDKLSPAHLEEYRYHGALLIAGSATDKARLIYAAKGWQKFPLEFEHRLYWFALDLDKFGKESERAATDHTEWDEYKQRDEAIKAASAVTQIANCHPTALYYQANAVTDESWYYFRVDFPHDGPGIKNTFTGGQLAAAGEFKKRLLSIAPGAVWEGSAKQLDRLLRNWTESIKTVQTIDYVGYAKEHGAWIYHDVAVKGGKVYRLNAEDYFDLPKLAVKSITQSVALDINTDAKAFRTDWVSTFWTTFGPKGVVALAFWLGSLFAEQIRDRQKSFPFLEIVGEAGSGKSTLIEFLWKLMGRLDYEGFDPAKSSPAGRSRNFAQVSGLPVVLIESDREAVEGAAGRPGKNFDWDELKTAYNGRAVRSRGVRNGGNETYEPPFRGTVVISQNMDVSASDAILQRIVHLGFDRQHHTDATKTAAARLETTPIEQLSGFLPSAITAEKDILALVTERFPQHEKTLLADPEVRNFRLVKNHAQIMGFVDALPLVIPLSEEQRAEARGCLIDMARERQKAISSDHPLVQDFWDVYDYIEDDADKPILNHSRDDRYIAINLVHFGAVCEARKIRNAPLLADLKRVLRTSRARKFIDIKTVNSAVSEAWNRYRQDGEAPKPATVKCWVFERK